MKKLIPIISLSLIIIWGCNKNQLMDCVELPTQVPFETILSDSVTQGCRLQNIDDNELVVNLVIQSQSQYENFVTCIVALPDIDFSEKTLLIGRLKAPDEDKIIKQSVTVDCNGIYLYSVEIGWGIAAHPISVYYHALIPKISVDTKVEFDIKLID